MNPIHRLHNLRMANDAASYAMDEMRPRFDRMKNRHDNGTAPRAVVVSQLFQTPPAVAKLMVSMLWLKPGARVLEPSAGLGRILDALPTDCDVTAVDIAPECTGELFRQNRDRVTIKQRDFLSLTPAELGLFDAVAMNPPFTMRSDIKHILHARKFLKPHGQLIALCLSGPFQHAQLKPLADSWIELPAGSFKSSGTNVNVAMLTLTALQEIQ